MTNYDRLKAHAGPPLDADRARELVAVSARETPNIAARIGTAKLVAKYGNYTDAGKAVWAEYLAAGCPAA